MFTKSKVFEITYILAGNDSEKRLFVEATDFDDAEVSASILIPSVNIESEFDIIEINEIEY